MGDNRLKLLRKAAKKTQKDIAAVVSITQNAYSYWETGKVKIDSESLKKLSEFYGVSLDFLSGLPFRLTRTVDAWDKSQQEEYYTSDENKKVYLEYLWGAPVFIRDEMQESSSGKILQLDPRDIYTNNAFLTEHELKLLKAYRSQPQMQNAVDRLLGISDGSEFTVYAAAKSTDDHAPRMIKKSKEEWAAIENAPDTDDDLL